MASCISSIRVLMQKEKDTGFLTDDEQQQKNDCFDYLFRRMNREINYLIGKNNFLPGMTPCDIRQELYIQLIDDIIPRLAQRRSKGRAELGMKKVVDITQDEKCIERYLSFCLTQKYYRLSRAYYVHDKKAKQVAKNQKEFANPLDGAFVSLGFQKSTEVDDTETFVDVKDDAWERQMYQKLQVNSLMGKVSSVGQTILKKALETAYNKTDYTAFTRTGSAKNALKRVETLLRAEYGIDDKRTNKRTKRRTTKQPNIAGVQGTK